MDYTHFLNCVYVMLCRCCYILWQNCNCRLIITSDQHKLQNKWENRLVEIIKQKILHDKQVQSIAVHVFTLNWKCNANALNAWKKNNAYEKRIRITFVWTMLNCSCSSIDRQFSKTIITNFTVSISNMMKYCNFAEF